MDKSIVKDTINLPINLLTDLLAAAKQQLGTARLIALIVGETEPRAKPKQVKPAKKPVPDKKPPTHGEQQKIILEKLKTVNEVKAAQFHHYWSSSEHKRAKKVTTESFNALIKAGKVVKTGTGTGTIYKLAGKS
ncbi:hypothetical protein OV203_26110 [Nannocystis sp. ILAH1]|uniref:hypothetical protein n=1 Tax=Nannocystis sp. ILAH1 TaxID=2996789 RepID=UPI00227214D9|nr:hypothetical protein [Nannocystis sp. ILAH1]MCY0990645.1 hypothetical protein [Nannocystis sp. ILAH1]